MPGDSEDRYRAPALDKGLDILELLAGTADGLSQAEIAKALDRTPNEIYRMLDRLVRRDFVRRTPEDRYAQRVQASYGQFMHETPWYRYPFGTAFRQLWTFGPSRVRGAERHLALSLEYGVKALYAKLIGWASGTALGQDERTMRVVLAAQPEQIAAVDPRLRHVTGDTYEAPRYAQFSDIAQKLAAAGIGFREIAGNDDVFLTVLMPKEAPGTPLLRMDLADRPGWERRGLLVKVTDLSRTLAALPAGAFEHLYDY